MKKIILILVLLYNFNYVLNSQPSQNWLMRFNGIANNIDQPRDLTVDKEGNVIVFGYSWTTGSVISFCTIKYNSTGTLQWIKYKSTSSSNCDPNSIKSDDLGNIYVIGTDNNTRVSYLIKYDKLGNQILEKSFNNISLTAMVLDPSGNYYVAGDILNASWDSYLAKLDSAGNIKWSDSYNGSANGQEHFYSLTLDKNYNVIATGYANNGNGGNMDVLTIKYTNTGQRLWVQLFNGSSNQGDLGRKVVTDKSGNIYVGGVCNWSNQDYCTIKYDSNGNLQWSRTYNGSGNGTDYAWDLVCDDSSNTYITGSTTSSNYKPFMCTIKYDKDGNTIWVNINDSTNQDGIASKISLDKIGNVYVAGMCGYDFCLIKYNNYGTKKWETRYNGPGNSNDQISSLIIDNNFNVYVTGTSVGNGTNQDYCTIKYTQPISLNIVKPNGGEIFYGLNNDTIKWNSENVANIKIELTTNNGTNWSLLDTMPGFQGKYIWTVNNINSTNCKIKLTDLDDENKISISNSSFTIKKSTNTLNTGLIAYYPFENNANDISGNGRHGTIMNHCEFLSGKIGNCIKVFGEGYVTQNGGHILLPFINYNLINNFTISLWVKEEGMSHPDGEAYIGYGDHSSGLLGIVHSVQSNQLSYNIGPDGISFAYDNNDLNKFVLYTLVYENGVMKAFKNVNHLGSLTASVNVSNTTSALGRHWWGLGGSTSTRFIGAFDDLRIYNRALSQSEINQLYQNAQSTKSITVIAPNGGETWTVGQSYNINWSSSNISKVKIEISTNNGVNWSAIATDVDAYSGGFSYTAQNNKISNNCKIRISEKGNPSFYDESNSVYSIIQQTSNDTNLYFRVNDIASSVKKIKLKYIFLDYTNNTKIDLSVTKFLNTPNNDLAFFKSDFNYFLGKPLNVTSIQLLDQNNNLIGHITFRYEFDGRCDAQILVDDILTAFAAGYLEYPEWEYYNNQNEKLLSILIPPKRLFSRIHNYGPPTLLVHGVGGSFPYWDENMFAQLSVNNDIWQFYYPYDQKIEASSVQLRKAIDYLVSVPNKNNKNSFYQDKIAIIAHSMGGLVTRKYIQSSEYDQRKNIRKLLMLGTPNNGSLSSYQLTNNFFSGIVGWFIGKDRNAPAYYQMTPGSNFLMTLNNWSTNNPKQLFDGSINKKTYLVLTGTENEYHNITKEIQDQDDGVVSVSSASLKNVGIPLITKKITHSGLTTPMVHENLFLNFLNDGYNPDDPGNTYYQTILNLSDGFYTQNSIIKPDISLNNITHGMLIFSIPGSTNSKNIEIKSNSNESVYRLSTDGYIPDDYKLIKVENTSNYFLVNESGRNDLGMLTNNGMQKTFFFEKSLPKILLKQRISKDTTIFVKPLETNVLIHNLGYYPDKLNIFNSEYSLWGMFYPKNKKNKLFTDKINSTKEFYVDNTIDTLSFYLFVNTSDTACLNNNFHIVDPNSQIIDSLYASQHNNCEYYFDYQIGMFCYTIITPIPGGWTTSYNSNLINPVVYVPINSNIFAKLVLQDTSHYVGDTVFYNQYLSKPINYSNIVFHDTIDYTPSSTDTTITLGASTVVQINDSTFRGSFIVSGKGNYTINSIMSCIYQSEQIERRFSESFDVKALKPPVLLTPLNDNSNVNSTCNFSWTTSPNSILYKFELFNVNLNYFEKSMFVGNATSIQIDSLEFNTNYIWRVRSFSLTDSSDWSNYFGFSTRVAYSDPPDLYSPPNYSGGVVVPITFSWYPSEEALSYNIQIATDSSFTNIVINDTNITDTTKSYSNLNSYTNYYWKVRTRNSAGNSSFSPFWKFKSLGLPILVSPLSPANNSINLSVRNKFLWQKSYDEIDKYIKIGKNIYKAETQLEKESILSHFGLLKDNMSNPINKSKNQTDNIWSYWFEITTDTLNMNSSLKDSTVTDTSKIMYDFEYNKTYYWRVKSQNEIGWSGYCPWSKFSTIYAPNITSRDSVKTGSNSITLFGISDLVFSANVSSGSIETLKFNSFDPITITKPSEIVSISSYYWKFNGGSTTFTNGKVSIPIAKLKGVSDSSKLVWITRSNPGDNWQNIGGIILNGRLESLTSFSSLSEFAIASLDSQFLKSTFLITKLCLEGYKVNNPNYKLITHDTIKAYLHQVNSPYSIVDSCISVIDSVSLITNINFTNVSTGKYYIKIKHRNSIETWSRNNGDSLIRFMTGFYDFTNSQNSAFGNNLILKDSLWCIYSGDVNQDGVIDLSDLLITDNDAYMGANGFYITDVNGDGVVDLSDLLIVDNNAYNGIYSVTPNILIFSKKDIYKTEKNKIFYKNTKKRTANESKKNKSDR